MPAIGNGFQGLDRRVGYLSWQAYQPFHTATRAEPATFACHRVFGSGLLSGVGV
jgi:hypothetical protein